jgi:diguanylate cyclase (GGDEF)-like protein
MSLLLPMVVGAFSATPRTTTRVVQHHAAAADHWGEMAAMPTDPTVLLAVVEAQSEIASADLDLDAVMALVCTKAQELTGADGAAVELAEGDELVCRAASGSARPLLGLRDASHDGAVSTLSVPLMDRNGPVGALKVVSGHRRAFAERDEDTLTLLSGLIAAQMRHAQVYARAEEASREDSLTGLGNSRAYHERLDAEVARAIRHGRPLTLCLIELEGADALAAHHGASAVDAALVRIGRALCAVRACDEAFRIEPLTFALLLFETTEREADVVLRRLNATLAVRDASGLTISVLAARKQARNRDVDVLQDAVRDALERARRAAGRLASAA